MSNSNIHVTATDGILTILEGQAYVHKPEGFAYRLNSLRSFIDLVVAKGAQPGAVIFYNDNGMAAILDDAIMDRPKDRASYEFCYSMGMSDWQGIFGRACNQKDLITFLKNHPADIVGGADYLISILSKLKVVTEIVGDYQHDDNNNVSFFFKSKDGEGNVKIPGTIEISLPIFEESTLISTLELEVELTKPKSENERPTIKLTCQKFNYYRKQAVDFEVDKLKQELSNYAYLILAGQPK